MAKIHTYTFMYTKIHVTMPSPHKQSDMVFCLYISPGYSLSLSHSQKQKKNLFSSMLHAKCTWDPHLLPYQVIIHFLLQKQTTANT